jgi:hypothetical protein
MHLRSPHIHLSVSVFSSSHPSVTLSLTSTCQFVSPFLTCTFLCLTSNSLSLSISSHSPPFISYIRLSLSSSPQIRLPLSQHSLHLLLTSTLLTTSNSFVHHLTSPFLCLPSSSQMRLSPVSYCLPSLSSPEVLGLVLLCRSAVLLSPQLCCWLRSCRRRDTAPPPPPCPLFPYVAASSFLEKHKCTSIPLYAIDRKQMSRCVVHILCPRMQIAVRGVLGARWFYPGRGISVVYLRCGIGCQITC